MLIIHFYTLTRGYDGSLKDFGLVTQLKSIGPQKYAILSVAVAIPASKYPTIWIVYAGITMILKK